MKTQKTPIFFLAPFLVIYLLFIILPIVFTFFISLHSTGLGGSLLGNFIGFNNYLEALNDERFWNSVLNMAYFGALWIPLMLLLSLGFALYLDTKKGLYKHVFKLIIFIPFAVPTVIGSAMWSYMYNPSIGAFTFLLKLININVNLLSPNYVMYAMLNIVAWQYTGFNTIILLAGLSAIPPEVYEAAKIDGAGPLSLIRYIKLPFLKRYIAFITVITIIGVQLLFNEPYTLSRITHIPSDFTPNIYLYRIIIDLGRYGYVAALAFIILCISFVVSYAILRKIT